MLLAHPCLRLANMILESTQASHELAISTIIRASEFLVDTPLPDELHLTCVTLLRDVCNFADNIGHNILLLYFAILAHL